MAGNTFIFGAFGDAAFHNVASLQQQSYTIDDPAHRTFVRSARHHNRHDQMEKGKNTQVLHLSDIVGLELCGVLAKPLGGCGVTIIHQSQHRSPLYRRNHRSLTNSEV